MGKKEKKRKLPKGYSFYDYTLLFLVVFLCAFGLIMLYSTTSYSNQVLSGDSFRAVKSQAVFMILGFVVMIFISKIDYHFWLKFAALAFVISLVMLVLVQFIGKESHGEKRWLVIFGISIQPAELMKIAVVMCMPCMINYLYPRLRKGEIWPWGCLWIFVVFSAIFVIVSNLSSAIIVAGIGAIVIFVSSKRKWPYVLCAAGGITALVLMYKSGFLAHVLKTYQMERITAWLDPMSDPDDAGYQILQSLYAIGSGGLFGKGLGQSIQKLGYLPESQNDMIFAIICEELGIFGGFLVIVLFALLIWRLMILANNAPDLKGSLLVTAVLGHIAMQVIFNLCVATNLMPNTGISLPFISSGGSSIVCLMVEIGLVLSVSNQIRLVD